MEEKDDLDVTDIFDELTFMSRSYNYDDENIGYYSNLLILSSGIIAFAMLNYFS